MKGTIVCPECEGDRFVIEIQGRAECCGHSPNGNCCNQPMYVEEQVQCVCEVCSGSGKIEMEYPKPITIQQLWNR